MCQRYACHTPISYSRGVHHIDTSLKSPLLKLLGLVMRQVGTCRLLLVAEDDSVLLVEDGKVVWTREEGLAGVESTLFVDLPAAAADVEADYRASRPSLMDRVNAEVLTVKVGPATRTCLELHWHLVDASIAWCRCASRRNACGACISMQEL